MTEYAAEDPERRCVAVNRWLPPIVAYCRYKKSSEAAEQNKYIMNEKVAREMYEEIEHASPAFEYCLVPRKIREKSGASMPRSSSEESTDAAEYAARDLELLDKCARELYDWMDAEKTPRARMMLKWQVAGGLSYVASVHHRATRCFRYEGNTRRPGRNLTGTL